jgi:hypothetical protein
LKDFFEHEASELKARSKELLERAIAAMLAAIEIYNKPSFPYRAESFTILAVNAWELLLKSKWLADHDNRMSTLYVRLGGGTKRKRIKKTAAGNSMTYGLNFLANKLGEAKVLDDNAWRNLTVLGELRDSAVHFYHQNPEFESHLQGVGAAAVRNFRYAVVDWFNEDLSTYNISLMPIAFFGSNVVNTAIATREEKRFLKFVADQVPTNESSSSRYAVAMNVELRFVRSTSKDAIAVKVTADKDAPAVRFTEEQIRERYPWDYWELTRRCKDRYTDFKIGQKYHAIRKSLESDGRYMHIRRLDPGNLKSSTKAFFSPAIIDRFDKDYKRNA